MFGISWMGRPALIGLAAVAILTVTGGARAEVISLRSGNGSVPGTDSLITMKVGPVNSAFGAFTATDFTDAQSGANAFIIAKHPAWKAHLGSDPAAEWISSHATGVSEGYTALYAIDFTISSAAIASAILDFNFLIDNALGDAINEGLFVNGTAVAGTKRLGAVTSYFTADQAFTGLDITALVNPGLNTLYINAVDLGGPGALQFSANIDVTAGELAAEIPEPAALALLAAGLLGAGLLRRRAVR